MVCVKEDEKNILCYVHKDVSSAEFKMRSTDTIGHFTLKICKKFEVYHHMFELYYCKCAGTEIQMTYEIHKTLKEMGITADQTFHNFRISDATLEHLRMNFNWEVYTNRNPNSDGLYISRSASPTAFEGPDTEPAVGENMEPDNHQLQLPMLGRHESVPYIGLVNQAMTCYLNSLLQALYMTPEFRNALYHWEFKGSDTATSIPYQLQTLFLNLQTSAKSAVETIELTRSFGWDLREAWQQHDIQELCRVMFDALEQTFKDTDQADFINRLYQGKMLDYVKCLECQTEKTREDTFLDIPLPVRPFGSLLAYRSIEDALRAFVEPETLDGNNQYFCDKCNKKCDAHKGLKFSQIPYLLTLHLKRFDFDYSTMYRIKLNDKLTFPETLDLNSFISTTTTILDETVEPCEEVTAVKCDDGSTADSGSALDDESCMGTEGTGLNGGMDECQEDDEGIDMSTGTENDKKCGPSDSSGPYVYELFSIMIHSGSASGGHYYAYVKDFKKNKWFCFDDQTVYQITVEDIYKTYGGGSQRSYYSGSFSSSTNAYMLMYRQIDEERNVNAMSTDEFPPHIKKLMQNIRTKEEYNRIYREREKKFCTLKLYYKYPNRSKLHETTMFLQKSNTLTEAVQDAFHKGGMEGVVPIEQCRLVSYNKMYNTIECSLEGHDDDEISDVISILKNRMDFLLEIRGEDAEWVEYKPGGLNVNVYLINVDTEDVDGPVVIRGYESQTLNEFRTVLAKTLNMNPQTLKMAVESYSGGIPEPMFSENEEKELRNYMFQSSGLKMYVSDAVDEDPEEPTVLSKFNSVVKKFNYIVSFEVQLPVKKKSIMLMEFIPLLDENKSCCDKAEIGASESKIPARASPIQNGVNAPESEDLGTALSDQSNSEDSSLSDSDRTLVGDAPDNCLAQVSSTSNSPATSDHHLSSPEDGEGGTSMFPDENINYYFRAVELSPQELPDTGKRIKVFIDKRVTLAWLKKELEPYVGVCMKYFKVYKLKLEWTELSQTLKIVRDGEKLQVKLGRVLKDDEYPGFLYQLVLNSTEPIRFLSEWVITRGETVGQVKKKILDNLKLDIPYERFRLRKKHWDHPHQVYMDHEIFSKDIYLHSYWHLYVQELLESEPVTKPKQLVLLVRRWSPSTIHLQPFQEIIVDGETVEDLKNAISELSKIPVKFVDFASLEGPFPYEVSSLLSVHNDLDWNNDFKTLSRFMYFHSQGYAFVYKDKRERLKTLTREERKEIISAESARVGTISKSTMFSPRKERALKIHLGVSNTPNTN